MSAPPVVDSRVLVAIGPDDRLEGQYVVRWLAPESGAGRPPQRGGFASVDAARAFVRAVWGAACIMVPDARIDAELRARDEARLARMPTRRSRR